MKNIKSFLLGALVTLGAITSGATSNRIYVKDFAINPGETRIVEIYVESSTDIRSFQTDIQLPEGLTMDCSKAKLTKRNNDHIMYADTTGTNLYTIMAFSLNNVAFNGTDGTIIEVPITASEQFSRSATIEIQDATIEATDKTILLIDGEYTCHVYIAKPASLQPDDTTSEEPDVP